MNMLLMFQATGASIQVASEMLPNSTERAVTVSGTADAITECIKYVCGIMLEVSKSYRLLRQEICWCFGLSGLRSHT